MDLPITVDDGQIFLVVRIPNKPNEAGRTLVTSREDGVARCARAMMSGRAGLGKRRVETASINDFFLFA